MVITAGIKARFASIVKAENTLIAIISVIKSSRLPLLLVFGGFGLGEPVVFCTRLGLRVPMAKYGRGSIIFPPKIQNVKKH